MAILQGEWWNQGTRPILKVRAGAVTADVEQGDVASCAVQTAALASGSVTSEKASANLGTRSYLVVMSPPEPNGLLQGGSSLGGWSTTYTLWRPIVTVTLQGFAAFTLQEYEMACNDSLTLYGNQGTCIGDVRFCGQSTSLPGGTRIAGGNLNLLTLPAGTDVKLKYTASTCSIPIPIALQFDFVTSG